MQELIRELRHWRGDVLIGLPTKRTMAFIKVVKSDLIKALEIEKNWGSEQPFRFRIINNVGLLEYEGFKMPSTAKKRIG